MPPPTKIAIIGSGISGLVVAYRLNQIPDVQVTLLEKAPRLGMDAHRADWQCADGSSLPIDVPSRMFNREQWPHLVQLYDEIGVAYESVDASQSFCKQQPDGRTGEAYLELDIAFRPEVALRTLLSSSNRGLLQQAKQLMQRGRRDLDHGIDSGLTLGQYLDAHQFSHSFKYEFLYATLSSTVCTCSYESLDQYPAVIILSMLRRLTDDRSLMRTSHGTNEVVRRLSAGLSDVRTNYPVSRVVDDGSSVLVCSSSRAAERFDLVVLSTQANTALKLQPGINEDDRSDLAAICYEDVSVFVHTDNRLMPKDRECWRTFNVAVPTRDSADLVDRSMCTVWLNRFDRRCSRLDDVFQTIRPIIEADHDKVIANVTLQRPNVTPESIRAIKHLNRRQRDSRRRVWYCGSWAHADVPLLETGVRSAEMVVRAVQDSLPVISAK